MSTKTVLRWAITALVVLLAIGFVATHGLWGTWRDVLGLAERVSAFVIGHEPHAHGPVPTPRQP